MLAQHIADMFRGQWTEPDKVQAEIISIHPPNRCSFNFYRRAAVREREAQRQIKTWFNRMFTLNAHPGLGQIGRDTLPHTSPAEIVKNELGWYAPIGTKHESNASRLGRTRLR